MLMTCIIVINPTIITNILFGFESVKLNNKIKDPSSLIEDEYKQIKGKEKAKADSVFEKSKAEKNASEAEEIVKIYQLISHRKRENLFQKTLPDCVD